MNIKEFFLTTSFGKLFIKQWKPANSQAKAPVILMHDSLGSVDLWRSFPEQLAIELARPVIAYDRLGFGKSEARTTLPAFNFIEQEAEQYFPQLKSALKLNHYTLLGHSVGGAMALNIAATDKSCQAVITMAAQAYVEQLTIQGIEEAKSIFHKQEQLNQLIKWHGNKAQWVLTAWTDIWLAAEFRQWRLTRLPDVHCPVLAIHGENDEYGSIAFPKFIVNNTGAAASMVLLKSCGHMPHKTHTEHVLKAISHFIKQNSFHNINEASTITQPITALTQ
ncbi:hydrolase [Thalassotalea insulae]|uniref:Hydrolase n=1 Tax=Thalassotalea insulae TaxID=2056778 RepID=A0ABQ6GTW1_9GAMM|nr:alpha/beta hydrolase [Thalassotalea insulae]GLX79363.1 hydrolase [Thalassotalea insulae]